MTAMIAMGLMLHQHHYDDDDHDDDPLDDHVEGQHVESHLLHHLHLCLRVQSWGDCQLFKWGWRWLLLLQMKVFSTKHRLFDWCHRWQLGCLWHCQGHSLEVSKSTCDDDLDGHYLHHLFNWHWLVLLEEIVWLVSSFLIDNWYSSIAFLIDNWFTFHLSTCHWHAKDTPRSIVQSDKEQTTFEKQSYRWQMTPLKVGHGPVCFPKHHVHNAY